MYSYFVTIFIQLVAIAANAQPSSVIGARANGLGYASATLSDEWALFNNPAGNASHDSYAGAITFDVNPAFAPFNRKALCISIPLPNGVTSMGFSRFGDDVFNEQLITIGYANKIGNTSLGLSLNYLQVSAENFGRKRLVTGSVGGITKLTPFLSIGAYVININQPEISDDEKVPSMLSLGTSAKVSPAVSWLLQIDKTIRERALLRTAIEYQLRETVILRTGIVNEPFKGFLGVGIHKKRLRFDYAFTWSAPGNRHQLSLCMTKPRRK